jgi:hypothetical protein
VAVHVTNVPAGAGDTVAVERAAAVHVSTESVYVAM